MARSTAFKAIDTDRRHAAAATSSLRKPAFYDDNPSVILPSLASESKVVYDLLCRSRGLSDKKTDWFGGVQKGV
jgi:hypothetical protein